MSGNVGGFRGRRGMRWWAVVAASAAALCGCGVGHRVVPEGMPAAPPPPPGGDVVDVQHRTPNPDAGVVDVVTQLEGNARGAGTGIVLTPDGTVLTNNHVIDGATSIQVTDVTSGRSYPAAVTGYDVGQDVAVLRLAGAAGLPTEPLGDSSRIRPDDPVMAVGNAGGRGGPPDHSTGRVTGVDQAITAGGDDSSERLDGMLRVSARLEQGESGGPLLDAAGRVVGVDTATSEEPGDGHVNGPGYAIPINTALRVSDAIRSGRPAPGVHLGGTGVLGVGVVPPEALSSGEGVRTGAAAVTVSPGSGAERAGISPGDVIVSVDGHPVESPDELTDLVRSHHPGDVLRLEWTGAAGQRSADVTLGEGPPA